MPAKWLPLWPPSSRKIRAPHIIILAVISTLLVVAVMREHLLWALASLTGYSTASFPPTATDTSALAKISNNPSPLAFSPDGTFKISVFEDLHFGEAEDLDWGPRQDEMTLKVMQTILDIEGPQLVVLNGDLITGENTMLENATSYVDMIVKPLVDGEYRWASAYGNHDQSFNLSSEAMLEMERKYGTQSLTDRMVEGNGVGVTNYYVPVFGAVGDAIPEAILWFFDSQGGREFQRHDAITGAEIPAPSVVHERVVAWFQDTSTQLTSKYSRTLPSIAFVHIPVSAMSNFQKAGVDENREPGINDDNPLGSQESDQAFLKALVQTQALLAVFSGHEHGNDYCHPYSNSSSSTTAATGKTPFFCFGRHTGYGGYGHWTRGSRQVVLNRANLATAKPNIETWVRLEDGVMSGHVFLNETYGTDIYPKVNDTETKLPPPDP
jgi:predicted MPP superfamily phosphohydrolase